MSRLQDAIGDLFDLQLTAAEAVDRHFTADFRQRTHGQWDDRARFLARIGQLRTEVAKVAATVLDELVEGEHYAERHIIDLTLHSGERIVQEVYVFARRDAAGRFRCIEEVTLRLFGNSSIPSH